MQNNKKQRSLRQNASIHLYLSNVAQVLNDAGITVKTVLKSTPDLSCTPHNMKELLWRNFQEMTLGKKSTTQLETDEVTKVYEEINRYLGEHYGVHVPFPSMESMMWEDE